MTYAEFALNPQDLGRYRIRERVGIFEWQCAIVTEDGRVAWSKISRCDFVQKAMRDASLAARTARRAAMAAGVDHALWVNYRDTVEGPTDEHELWRDHP